VPPSLSLSYSASPAISPLSLHDALPIFEKELLRGHRLEALEFYRALVVPSLVAALRMRYGPRHYDFRMRYVYRELPPDVVRRLEGLAFVTDPEDLATKYRQARAWFDKAIEDVDEEQVRRDVAGTSKGLRFGDRLPAP